MQERRIDVRDRKVLEEVGRHVVVGKGFAFVQAAAFDAPMLRWVTRMMGRGRMAPVVSLLDRDAIEMFGVEIESRLPGLFLGSVTSDKGVYRADRDVVHLLVARPFRAGCDEVLEVRANGQVHAHHPVLLDRHGVAALQLRGLPTAEYEVGFRGQPDDVAACTFTVAEYRLAPLVASIAERRLRGADLSLTLHLDTFGVPVDGDVHVELMDAGQRAWRGTVAARDGGLSIDLRLGGEGPFTVNVQMVEHPGRTATVALVGSRAQERSLTLFSSLGTTVHGSLMPLDDARPVRGIWLTEGGTRTAPFQLERVDARRARLVARTRVASGRLVVLDPAWPRRRGDALAPSDPSVHEQPLYQAGERFFKQGEYEMALTAFREGRSRERSPHCYYAYYEACCLAGLGRAEEALGALLQSVEDGWSDFEHLRDDEDLAALRGHPGFDRALQRGLREIPFEELAPGQALEVDVPAPAAVLAIGAFVGGQAWEGWAVTVVPPACEPTVEVPIAAEPGADVEIRVRTGLERPAAVYLVVKDARLPSLDSPENRLAAGIKALAEEAGDCLGVGHPKESLLSLAPPPPPPMPVRAARGGGGPPGMVFSMDTLSRASDDDYGAVYPSAPMCEAPEGAMYFPDAMPEEGGSSAAAPLPPTVDEPEVLFAGLLETAAGVATKTLRLGPAFADYVVEAFVADGPEWSAAQGHFQAARPLFVNLETPAFVHPSDTVTGRLIAACGSGRMRVDVTRDGQSVQSSGEVDAHRCELVFPAAPGEFRAVVTDLATGQVYEDTRRVDVPGRLRRRARSVRLLQPGEEVRRLDDPSIRALRVLPGLDKPFQALVEATADYGHACCEQTAAKMLAACAMYALNGSTGRRAAAESIILAGVKREEAMWLRGRGFKMYPESPAEPNDYWGQLAARYLWNVELLREGQKLGAALAEGVDRCAVMALDACRAYRIEWPPRAASTCEEAWNVIRFGKDAGPRREALELLRATRPEGGGQALLPQASPPGMVRQRADCAFAAAGLLRGGIATDRALALRLANRVTTDLGPEGRLYSTVDSVAALAMMAELQRAAVLGGRAEVNGRELTAEAASSFTGEIESVRAIDGTLSVEVERAVEEDWEAFSSTLDVSVSLEQDGRVRRAFKPGDAVDLTITLNEGYQPGDIAWVCLPDSLSRLLGGAQVKRFAVDFADKAQVRVPLVATSRTAGPEGADGVHHFAVCVRNMFEEERAGNPGLLEVRIG